MRKSFVFIFVILLIVALEWPERPGFAQVEDFSKGRLLGIGFLATFSDPTFPASGLSTRLWFADLLGLEVDLWAVPAGASFTIRSFLKFFNTEIVDFYGGAGVAFFPSKEDAVTTFKVPFQGLVGLEISLNRRLAMISEVGAVFLDGKLGASAGLGVHFYF